MINSASLAVIAFSKAHGAIASTFNAQNSSIVISLESATFVKLPSALAVSNSSKVKPSALYTAKAPFPFSNSATATTFPPNFITFFTVNFPTFPNPWTATVALVRSFPNALKVSLIVTATPNPVASFLPAEPP